MRTASSVARTATWTRMVFSSQPSTSLTTTVSAWPRPTSPRTKIRTTWKRRPMSFWREARWPREVPRPAAEGAACKILIPRKAGRKNNLWIVSKTTRKNKLHPLSLLLPPPPPCCCNLCFSTTTTTSLSRPRTRVKFKCTATLGWRRNRSTCTRSCLCKPYWEGCPCSLARPPTTRTA